MKARLRELSPDIERLIRDRVKERVDEERATIATGMLLLDLYTLTKKPKDRYGRKRLDDFLELREAVYEQLVEQYGDNGWLSKVAEELRDRGVEFVEEKRRG